MMLTKHWLKLMKKWKIGFLSEISNNLLLNKEISMKASVLKIVPQGGFGSLAN